MRGWKRDKLLRSGDRFRGNRLFVNGKRDEKNLQKRTQLLGEMQAILEKSKMEEAEMVTPVLIRAEKKVREVPLVPSEGDLSGKDLDVSIKKAAKVRVNAGPVLIRSRKFHTPKHADTRPDDLLESIEIFIAYLNAVPLELEKQKNGEHQTDIETQDILHSIELSDHSTYEKIILFNKLKEVRERRRTHKVRYKLFEALQSFQNENAGIADNLKKLSDNLKNVVSDGEQCKYFLRLRTDLKTDRKVAKKI